jgi:hypothetical protein
MAWLRQHLVCLALLASLWVSLTTQGPSARVNRPRALTTRLPAGTTSAKPENCPS